MTSNNNIYNHSNGDLTIKEGVIQDDRIIFVDIIEKKTGLKRWLSRQITNINLTNVTLLITIVILAAQIQSNKEVESNINARLQIIQGQINSVTTLIQSYGGTTLMSQQLTNAMSLVTEIYNYNVTYQGVLSSLNSLSNQIQGFQSFRFSGNEMLMSKSLVVAYCQAQTYPSWGIDTVHNAFIVSSNSSSKTCNTLCQQYGIQTGTISCKQGVGFWTNNYFSLYGFSCASSIIGSLGGLSTNMGFCCCSNYVPTGTVYTLMYDDYST
jgi:hypothetical protein